MELYAGERGGNNASRLHDAPRPAHGFRLLVPVDLHDSARKLYLPIVLLLTLRASRLVLIPDLRLLTCLISCFDVLVRMVLPCCFL